MTTDHAHHDTTAGPSPSGPAAYDRYHIHTDPTPDIVDAPHRFDVDVSKIGLAKLLIKELWHYRGDLEVVASRPCVYGVFSGPVGGFSPRPEKCVGCLRCTTQYPDMVTVSPNPARAALGDAYLTPDVVDTILFESRTGQVPVKGQGYRGGFGGDGWDGMWTDMSEIVRPTRDGIHGREFISTAVDVGSKPAHLVFDDAGRPVGPTPRTVLLQVPILFDAPPASAFEGRGRGPKRLAATLAGAAGAAKGLALLPIQRVLDDELAGPHVAPILAPDELGRVAELPSEPRIVELASTDAEAVGRARAALPDTIIAVRVPLGADALATVRAVNAAGADVAHLVADLHGRGDDGAFVRDHIQHIHTALVEEGIRDELTLIVSGGIVHAEHVPKAILCGADAVALDTAPLAALQARFDGDTADRASVEVAVPRRMTTEWGTQRLLNLLGAWRDQLLEIMGAMGMREVRRVRGEMGRAMDQRDLEAEAFGDIDGFPVGGDA